MMDRDEFWHNEDDNAVLAEYLTQHGFDSQFLQDLGEMLISLGDPDRVPEPAIPRPFDETDCAVCGTRLAHFGTAGWRHLLSYGERQGCETPWPGV